MKYSSFTLFLAAIPAASFVPQVRTAFRSTRLFSRPDSSAAIQAALEASKKYGAASPEARVAWDIVEELDSSDNSEASSGSLDDECLLEEEISAACVDYGDKLEELRSILQENLPKVDTMKALATDLKNIKISVAKSAPKAKSPAFDKALEEAKATEAKYGKESPEAKIAWAELEDVAAAGLDNAMGARLDEECLVESALEACQALEELNKALNLQKK